MPTPHRHAEIIKKWADGHQIQVQLADGTWMDMSIDPPTFTAKHYRVKPEPTVLHGFIDPSSLSPTDISFTIFRPYQATSKDIPCTLTFFPDA